MLITLCEGVFSSSCGGGETLKNLIVVEDLERVVENCFNDPDLPAGICNIASGASTHQGWSEASGSVIMPLKRVGKNIPKANS